MGKIGALLTGAMIGGVIGIVFFSRSKALRQSIVKSTEGLASRLNEKIEEGKSVLTELQRKTDAARNTVKRAMATK